MNLHMPMAPHIEAPNKAMVLKWRKLCAHSTNTTHVDSRACNNSKKSPDLGGVFLPRATVATKKTWRMKCATKLIGVHFFQPCAKSKHRKRQEQTIRVAYKLL